MKLDSDTNILIVGLGLMGGSYARALTNKGYRVGAITNEKHSLDYALEHGIIAYGADTPDPDLIRAADLVVFALYPHVFLDWAAAYGHLLKPGAWATDVTGVKSGIVTEVQRLLPQDVEFIAAHPMAGREVYGVENSDERIFQNANYIVVPTEKNTPEAIALCEKLGEELGFSLISRLTPEEHDDMIGFLSQLTHVIAVTLMNCNQSPHMEKYTGDSFRDLTRIARINDAMWSELFLLNRDALLRHMDAFAATFEQFRQALKNGDTETMRDAMRRSTARRARFDKDKAKETKKL